MIIRILRFGWLGGLLLALAGVTVIGVAIGVAVARLPRGASAAEPAAPYGLVAVSVTGTRIVPPDRSHRPAANHAYVAIAVRVTNRGSTPVTYRLSDFLLRDQAGTAFDPDPGAAGLASASALPLQGSLQPGTSRTGELVFEVPMSDHGATLVWQPSVGAKITVPVTW